MIVRPKRPLPARAWSLVLGCLLCVASSSSVIAAEPVDFLRDVYPIFRERCYPCHGGTQQEGSLRLDRREFAQTGGHSGALILGGGEQNAVLERVTTDDPLQQMPRGGPPLRDDEIQILRRWVEQGTPWEDPAVPDFPDVNDENPRFAFSWKDWPVNVTRWSDEQVYRFVQLRNRLLIPFAALALFMLVCERLKSRQKRRVATEGGDSESSRLVRWLANVRPSLYAALFLLMLVVGLACDFQSQAIRADQLVERLTRDLDRWKGDSEDLLSTSGLRTPVRPHHPKRLGGVYYRGNDERSPRLFNGGFYRTAAMSVFFVDSNGRQLKWGDTIDGSQVFVRFDIEQSVNASPRLFADEVFSHVSVTGPSAVNEGRPAQTIRFEKLDETHWRAEYPLEVPMGDSRLQGRLYLNRGTGPHYAAEFTLQLHEGQIDEESELWMGYTMKPAVFVAAPEGHAPDDEWFSFRPIPEIEGAPATDPHLLGIDKDPDASRVKE